MTYVQEGIYAANAIWLSSLRPKQPPGRQRVCARCDVRRGTHLAGAILFPSPCDLKLPPPMYPPHQCTAPLFCTGQYTHLYCFCTGPYSHILYLS